MSAQVFLVSDDFGLLGTRYPASVLYDSQPAQVSKGTAAELGGAGVVGGIVDTEGVLNDDDAHDVRAALSAGLPLLLAPGSIAALQTSSGDQEGRLSSSAWLPHLPLRRAVDVLAAADLVAAGAVGVPLVCEVTTWIGVPAADSWDNDAPFARTEYEAMVFGLDLSEQLLGGELTATSWSRTTRGANATVGTVLHEGAGGQARQTVLPVALASAPSFSAVVTGDAGRILLRQPFAPGAVTVWDAARRTFRAPALRRPKANVQCPDTAQGGREIVEELEALLAGGQPDDVRRRAERLTVQTTAALRDPARTPGGDSN